MPPLPPPSSAHRPIAPRAAQHLLFLQRRWVTAGAALLAATAGFSNAVVLRLTGLPVSHLTGNTTRVTIDTAMGNARDLEAVLAIMLSFMIGASIAAAITGTSKVLPGRRYSAVLALEGMVLLAAAALLVRHGRAALPLAALACGLQNGMANGFFGTVIRTTHLTGVLTDIGVMVGHWVRRRRFPPWRFALLGSIAAAFLVGGILGAVVAGVLGPSALYLPAVSCLVGAGGFDLWLARRRAATRSVRGGQEAVATDPDGDGSPAHAA
ncbi:MAG TPA: YoaK family protein [Gemmatimonadaceae bacterium]|nr:YoaK family protein [Gemmatimonadaceae bacterium]